MYRQVSSIPKDRKIWGFNQHLHQRIYHFCVENDCVHHFSQFSMVSQTKRSFWNAGVGLEKQYNLYVNSGAAFLQIPWLLLNTNVKYCLCYAQDTCVLKDHAEILLFPLELTKKQTAFQWSLWTCIEYDTNSQIKLQNKCIDKTQTCKLSLSSESHSAHPPNSSASTRSISELL